jgi:hypothetical protein
VSRLGGGMAAPDAVGSQLRDGPVDPASKCQYIAFRHISEDES